MDIFRQIRLPLTINSNDAQAYYYQIFLWIIFLELQQIGLSYDTVISMTNTLQSATRDINTAFELLIEKYFPTNPSLQGSK